MKANMILTGICSDLGQIRQTLHTLRVAEISFETNENYQEFY